MIVTHVESDRKMERIAKEVEILKLIRDEKVGSIFPHRKKIKDHARWLN